MTEAWGKGVMAEGEQQIELKFRIFDGTDISHNTYASSTSVASLKQQLVGQWPQDKSSIPKSINDFKLIHAGKVLENNKTLAESRLFLWRSSWWSYNDACGSAASLSEKEVRQERGRNHKA
ncbi:hypothetical protein QQ045_020747 [Rhodiola kirilowii]